MRRSGALLLAILAACLIAAGVSSAASAKRDRDWDTCNGSDDDASIIGCTNVLNRGARETQSDRATAYNNRGWSYSDKGDHDRAIADFDEAIRLDPKLAIAFVNRGWSYERKGDYDRAIADYDEAIRLDPNYSLAHNNRGWARNLKGEYDQAIVDFGEAIRTDPKDATAYVNRCDAYNRKGQQDRAVQDCEAAIRLDRNNASAYATRGDTYFQKGQVDPAIRDYDRAIRLEPKLGWARVHRGVAYEKKGDIDRARADFTTALAIPPEDKFDKEATEVARDRLTALGQPSPAQRQSQPAPPASPAPPAASSASAPVAPSPPPASEQMLGGRVALVIGNAAYPDDDHALPQPVKDARAIAEELRRDDFDVITGEDVTKQKLTALLGSFKAKIKQGSTALVFFSSYGIQSGKQSYLIPVDAQIWAEGDVKRDAISIESILAEMNAAGAAVKLVIIDAARRNPFERRFRGLSTGLAPLNAPAGTLAIYSASPDKVVNDSDGANSLFLTELLKQIRTPGLSAEAIFNGAQKDVSRASRNEQLPWVSSSLVDDFFFGKATPPASPAPSSSSPPTPGPTPER
ncbi:MAG TPA: tetratricopeptide repeat protein [Rhodoplanes sp.]|nr:tetratricopeptide repeat protein [Rhodoplanes sp.]